MLSLALVVAETSHTLSEQYMLITLLEESWVGYCILHYPFDHNNFLTLSLCLNLNVVLHVVSIIIIIVVVVVVAIGFDVTIITSSTVIYIMWFVCYVHVR